MVSESLLLRCASIVESIGKLPGAPTPYWCERAATALSPLAPLGLTLVSIVHAHESTGMRETSSVGAWSPNAERSAQAIRRLQKSNPPQMPSGQVAAHLLAQYPLLRELAVGELASATIWIANQPLPRCPETSLHVHILRPAMTSVGSGAINASIEQQEIALASAVITTLTNFASDALPSRDGQIRWLTRRESEVLEQLTLGYSIREIAELLGLSHHTVQDHVKHLHTKVEANNRGELVARALGRRSPDGRNQHQDSAINS